ncbi:putative srp receptor beta subunit protein [Neofusicoccum parvum UCRNP2]|uniref:Signal recognition particle receptor subunit beta n=1 Tax=Botryosphaeria parva (strain UCR-NP2) TaxID=1287680 RepID=R1FY18_BOTPV|nr:putative srp receptor beta subunit protein [Neofusicoccum parvum UCRNP2]
MVEWYEPDSWVTKLFGAHLSTFILTLVVAFGLPLCLHLWLYRHRTPINTAAFVLVGPSGAGKTSLLTALETGRPLPTHPSQTSLRATLILPDNHIPFSARYRSVNDPTNAKTRGLAVTDTPGHGKLRSAAFASALAAPINKNLRGIIYLVDAAALAAPEGLAEAAEYLHDVLLALQRRYTSAKTSKGPAATPVLVAANKLDLFTALPPQLVRAQLEQEIEKVRTARAKGILDVGASEDTVGEEHEWLGGGGEGRFEFKQMEEMNVPVEVVGGSVVGEEDGPDVNGWWAWIAAQM